MAVVGRKEPVTIYEPFFPRSTLPAGKISGFLPRGWKNFIGAGSTRHSRFLPVLRIGTALSLAYVGKCRSLIAQPPEMWNGVWVVTSK